MRGFVHVAEHLADAFDLGKRSGSEAGEGQCSDLTKLPAILFIWIALQKDKFWFTPTPKRHTTHLF